MSKKLVPKKTARKLAFPNLPYLPRDPKKYSPEIAIIACGGITKHHLTAYKAAGYRVTALCDVNRDNAEKRRVEFYPECASLHRLSRCAQTPQD